MPRPRVRSVESREILLQRYQAFAHPERLEESVSQRILRRVSTRGLSKDKPYLFVLDGAKALKKAFVSRFGSQTLIQRGRVHKKRNLQKYLPKKHHGMLSLKLKMAWGMTEYDKGLKSFARCTTGWRRSTRRRPRASTKGWKRS
jgi:transposase-like protein